MQRAWARVRGAGGGRAGRPGGSVDAAGRRSWQTAHYQAPQMSCQSRVATWRPRPWAGIRDAKHGGLQAPERKCNTLGAQVGTATSPCLGERRAQPAEAINILI